VAYVQAIVDNLEESTGRRLEAWLRLLAAEGPRDVQKRRDWLKAQGLGSTQASLVAERSLAKKANGFDTTAKGYLASVSGYVEHQYAGKRAALRPVYEAVLAMGLATGPEAKACPCQTVVPLFRNHVFAQMKPSSLSRIDLALALGDPAQLKAPGPRLLETGGFAKKDRLTHRIALFKPSDVDGTVQRWLEVAYQRDG
jgi:Domain of unknown function (DUF5655)